MTRRTYFLFDHQTKAAAFRQALDRRGWRRATTPHHAAVVLADGDVKGRRIALQRAHRHGARIFLYPHAARPNIFWDFPGTTLSTFVECQFVPARGHVDIMRAYGLSCRIEVVGWHLCPIRPFQPRAQLCRVVFAPIHPNANGFLGRLDREINAETLRALLPLTARGVTLIVRYLRDLEAQGLWRAPEAEYIQGKPDLSTREIDQADLVVSHQTFAHLAVARGVPTLMMGESHPPRWGGSEAEIAFVEHWDAYRDLLMYPLDILAPAEGDLDGLIARALRSDEEIADWRRRLIGEPFDGDRFVDVLEECL